MENPYHIIFRRISCGTKCGTPFIQMAQARREAYLALSKEEKLKWLEEKEKRLEEEKIYQKKENFLNIIRTILLVMIIIGIILICTQRFWVDSLVNFILKYNI